MNFWLGCHNFFIHESVSLFSGFAVFVKCQAINPTHKKNLK